MKTRNAPGAYDLMFLDTPPATPDFADQAKGASPYYPRISSGPVPPGSMPDYTPATRGHAGLPASLKDWLVCKEALEICRRNHNHTEAGDDAWVLRAGPVTRGLLLSKAASNERKSSGCG